MLIKYYCYRMSFVRVPVAVGYALSVQVDKVGHRKMSLVGNMDLRCIRIHILNLGVSPKLCRAIHLTPIFWECQTSGQRVIEALGIAVCLSEVSGVIILGLGLVLLLAVDGAIPQVCDCDNPYEADLGGTPLLDLLAPACRLL